MEIETRSGLEQMKILLTLLLGAAVQCPNKEIFIGRIKELDVNTQHAIVELIKQVNYTKHCISYECLITVFIYLIMYR